MNTSRKVEVRPSDIAAPFCSLTRTPRPHLVHRAFRGALGESATQAGSENAPGRLRFDFANPSAVPPSVLEDVESEVNEVLLGDLEVHAFVTSQEEARRIGAMALFGEKYGDQVRVVDIGDYSRELCGGTHVSRSAQLGGVKLLGESSIGAGVRRVEALVGIDAFRFLAREHVLLSRIAGLFRVPPEEAADRVEATIAELRTAEKELERLRAEAVLAGAGRMAQEAKDVGGVATVLAEAPAGTDGKALQRLVNDVRGRITDKPAVVAIAVRGDGKASIVIATNDGARDRGLAAGDLVRAAAGELGGKGGGKPDLAQGGGSQPDNVPAALAAVERQIREKAGSVKGVRIGVDVGTVRVGVAASDPDGVLASPVVTLTRDPRTGRDLDELADIVRDRAAVEVVVGLPRHLSGREGASVQMARDYADALADRIAPVPIRLVDERLTTVSAGRSLRASGVRGKGSRAVIDQAAAVALLQSALEER